MFKNLSGNYRFRILSNEIDLEETFLQILNISKKILISKNCKKIPFYQVFNFHGK